jgi:hypothetical protein
LWAQLLKLVYGREVETDALFFQHTFLVIVAKAIALAVLGLRDDNPKRVLSGAAFEAAGIFGAAESDFFDWVVAEPDGEALVRRILAHVRRFRLDQVESDILKILYESLIDRDERHGLGEYYTPDWLAAKIVRRAVERPIEQRVLDPACGSGTFLFHATGAKIAWDEAWTMDNDVQPLFPVPSCVVFGRRRATVKALPDTVKAYSGHLPARDASELVADNCLTVEEDAPRPAEGQFRGSHGAGATPKRKSAIGGS